MKKQIIQCSCCGRLINPTNSNLPEKGFYAADTGDYVHHICSNDHYRAKWKTKHKGLYSEMPITD